MRSPFSLLLSVTPYMSCLPVPSPALLLFSTHTWATQYLSCSEEPKSKHNIHRAVSSVLQTMGQSLSWSWWLFWCRPGWHWPSWSPKHTAGLSIKISYVAFIHCSGWGRKLVFATVFPKSASFPKNGVFSHIPRDVSEEFGILDLSHGLN